MDARPEKSLAFPGLGSGTCHSTQAESSRAEKLTNPPNINVAVKRRSTGHSLQFFSDGRPEAQNRLGRVQRLSTKQENFLDWRGNPQVPAFRCRRSAGYRTGNGGLA